MVKVSKSGLRSIFYLIGPAIIVASVVLGPGSIVTSSKVGCEFGYELLWVLGMSGIMMVSMVMLSAWIGVSHSKSFCTEIAERLGRPLAVAIGVTVFGIVAGFQVSNNVAILLAFEPFFDNGQIPLNYKIGILLVLNLLLIGVLFGLKKIYKPIEKLMMGLVLMMLIGFAVNFFFAGVSISGVLRGILPSIPDGFFENGFFPQISEDNETQKRFVSMPFGAVQGMIATTFSVAGAMYQAYLVKEKGWTLEKIRAGEVDSIFGITILIGISGLILCTAGRRSARKRRTQRIKFCDCGCEPTSALLWQRCVLLILLGNFCRSVQLLLGQRYDWRLCSRRFNWQDQFYRWHLDQVLHRVSVGLWHGSGDRCFKHRKLGRDRHYRIRASLNRDWKSWFGGRDSVPWAPSEKGRKACSELAVRRWLCWPIRCFGTWTSNGSFDLAQFYFVDPHSSDGSAFDSASPPISKSGCGLVTLSFSNSDVFSSATSDSEP